MSATWIERWAVAGSDGAGPLVAVKDLIDVAGSVTTAGSRAVAASASPASGDALCIRRVRAGGGRLVGKVSLHELAYGTSGINPWYGMAENPADPGRVPGGSSSGSAVAVAVGEADVALGSDTGGSVRIPAACCGVAGLKTTFGRVPLEGVWPLAPSFDTIGPLARDVRGVVVGMSLLEPGFSVVGVEVLQSVGLASLPGVEIDPVISAAVEAAVRSAELAVEVVEVEGWSDIGRPLGAVLDAEAWASDRHLMEDPALREGVGADVAGRLEEASRRTADEVEAGRVAQGVWTARLAGLVARHGVLVTPTLAERPPLPESFRRGFNILTAPVNYAGLPAISIPVPSGVTDRPAVGLQIVGPAGGDELLCAIAGRIEAAVG